MEKLFKELEKKYKIKITSWGISAMQSKTYINYYLLNEPCINCIGLLLEDKKTKLGYTIEGIK